MKEIQKKKKISNYATNLGKLPKASRNILRLGIEEGGQLRSKGKTQNGQGWLGYLSCTKVGFVVTDAFQSRKKKVEASKGLGVFGFQLQIYVLNVNVCVTQRELYSFFFEVKENCIVTLDSNKFL